MLAKGGSRSRFPGLLACSELYPVVGGIDCSGLASAEDDGPCFARVVSDSWDVGRSGFPN